MNLTNQFLIAMPTLADPNFHRTVTYMCAHSDEGAMGIVINRPTELRLTDVLDQMSIPVSDNTVSDITVLQDHDNLAGIMKDGNWHKAPYGK